MPTGIGQLIHVYPVMAATAATDSTDGVHTGGFVDLYDAESVEFLVSFSVLETSGTGTWDISVLATSTTTAAGAAIGFTYNLSGAVGADTMGGVTAVSSTAVLSITSDDGTKVVIVHVDPSDVAAAGGDKRYVYLSIESDTAGDNGPSGYSSVTAFIAPRHKQAVMATTTA